MKTRVHKKTCASVFIAVFIIGTNWTQPKWPMATNRNKVVSPHNGDYSPSEEQTTNACSNMYVSQSHCAESKKAQHKGLRTLWIHLGKIIDVAKLTYDDRK